MLYDEFGIFSTTIYEDVGGNEELKSLLKSKGYELLLDLGNDYLFILK